MNTFRGAGPFDQWPLEPTDTNPDAAERTPVSGKKERDKKNKKEKESKEEDLESMVTLNLTNTPLEEYTYNKYIGSLDLDKIVKNGFDENSVKQVSDLLNQLGFEQQDIEGVTKSLTESILKKEPQQNVTDTNQNN